MGAQIYQKLGHSIVISSQEYNASNTVDYYTIDYYMNEIRAPIIPEAELLVAIRMIWHNFIFDAIQEHFNNKLQKNVI